jgi:type I restriction enzyme S subunit
VVRLPADRRSEFHAYELAEGDIVLSLDRPLVSLGLKVARLNLDDTPSLLLQRVARLQPISGTSASYLYVFLRSPQFIDAISGHDQSLGVPHISSKQVENVHIPLPPLAEQGETVKGVTRQLASAEGVCQSMQSQLAALDHLPAALLRRAFAGEL